MGFDLILSNTLEMLDFALLYPTYTIYLILIIETNLAGDVSNLADRLKRIAGQTRLGGDFTAYGLKRALTEVLAFFPVYRTYIASDRVSESDRAVIQTAIARSRESLPILSIESKLMRSKQCVKPRCIQLGCNPNGWPNQAVEQIVAADIEALINCE